MAPLRSTRSDTALSLKDLKRFGDSWLLVYMQTLRLLKGSTLLSFLWDMGSHSRFASWNVLAATNITD